MHIFTRPTRMPHDPAPDLPAHGSASERYDDCNNVWPETTLLKSQYKQPCQLNHTAFLSHLPNNQKHLVCTVISSDEETSGLSKYWYGLLQEYKNMDIVFRDNSLGQANASTPKQWILQ